MKPVALLALVCLMATSGRAQERVSIGGGEFASVLPAGDAQALTHVDAFRLDRRPVTNAEYLAFVIKHPQWRRDLISAFVRR